MRQHTPLSSIVLIGQLLTIAKKTTRTQQERVFLVQVESALISGNLDYKQESTEHLKELNDRPTTTI